MTLLVFDFVCENGHSFQAPDTGNYGEFVVRGEGSEPGLLRALDNDVYTEVDEILNDQSAYVGMSNRSKAALLRSVFGVACDPAPDGTQIEVGRRAACAVCGSTKMASWEPIGPYTGSPFVVTHKQWRMLSTAERDAKVAESLHSLGCDG